MELFVADMNYSVGVSENDVIFIILVSVGGVTTNYGTYTINIKYTYYVHYW